jgi:hypothetical protein
MPEIVTHGLFEDLNRYEWILIFLVHAWGHRQWVLEKAKINVEEDWEYTTERIKNNFSNYSAWHRRSQLWMNNEWPLDKKLEHLKKGTKTL